MFLASFSAWSAFPYRWLSMRYFWSALSLLLIIMLCVPGTTLWSTISIDLGIPYWSISIALTVLITTCIVIRLLYMRRQLRNIRAGGGSEYISVSAVLIESASLYSINGIILVVSYGINSPIQNLALPVLGQTQVWSSAPQTNVTMSHWSVLQSIAPLLIILRVIQGCAWSSTTLAMLESETDTDLNTISKESRTHNLKMEAFN